MASTEVQVHITVDAAAQKLMSFIPAIWEQCLKVKIAKELGMYWEQAGKYEYEQEYIPIGSQGDTVTRPVFEQIRRDAMEYAVDEEFLALSRANAHAIAKVFAIPEQLLMGGVPDIGTLQDYPHQPAQIGFNPIMPPVAMPASAPRATFTPASSSKEPEFGLVILADYLDTATVEALSLMRAKVIREGENLDLGLQQYIVVFRDDDYHRNEARQMRDQIRDLIPRVDVVLVPMNGG